MAVDGKYGRVDFDQPNTIAEDEPVVVFRAQDRLLPALIQEYRAMCEAAGSPERHLALLDRTLEQVKAWQQEHFTKTPESAGLA